MSYKETINALIKKLEEIRDTKEHVSFEKIIPYETLDEIHMLNGEVWQKKCFHIELVYDELFEKDSLFDV